MSEFQTSKYFTKYCSQCQYLYIIQWC